VSSEGSSPVLLVELLLLDGFLASLVLVPSDGVFGCCDLAALSGCHTLNVCLYLKRLSADWTGTTQLV
jgi:hypothetical protein